MGWKRITVTKASAEVDSKKLEVAEASLAAPEKKKLIEEHQKILLHTANTDKSNPVVCEYI